MLITNEESELEENEWLLKSFPVDPSVIITIERALDFIMCSSLITFADTLQREAISMPTPRCLLVVLHITKKDSKMRGHSFPASHLQGGISYR